MVAWNRHSGLLARLSATLPTCLLLGVSCTQDRSSIAATYRGEDVASLLARFEQNPRMMNGLRDGEADSLLLLARLVQSDKEDIAVRAAEICKDLGVRARGLQDELRAALEQSPFWLVRSHVAVALGNMQVASAETLRALVNEACTSSVPRIRSDCVRALARVDTHAARRIASALQSGVVVKWEYATEALARIGEDALDVALDLMGGGGRLASVGRSSILAMGWRVIPRLEALGHSELAEDVLLHAPFGGVGFSEELEIVNIGPLPRVSQNLKCMWWGGDLHAEMAWACRGSRSGDEFQIERVRLIGRGKSMQVVLERGRVSLKLACIALRRVGVISSVRVRARDSGTGDPLMSSRSFCSGVSLEADRELIERVFVGRAMSNNVVERCHAEACLIVLEELAEKVEWRPREYDVADVECVARVIEVIRSRPDLEGAWVLQLFSALYDYAASGPFKRK